MKVTLSLMVLALVGVQLGLIVYFAGWLVLLACITLGACAQVLIKAAERVK